MHKELFIGLTSMKAFYPWFPVRRHSPAVKRLRQRASACDCLKSFSSRCTRCAAWLPASVCLLLTPFRKQTVFTPHPPPTPPPASDKSRRRETLALLLQTLRLHCSECTVAQVLTHNHSTPHSH